MNTQEWILITGGSRGIGRALVKHFAQKYNVVFTWLSQQIQAEMLEQECAELPGQVVGYCCDGRDNLQVTKLAAQLLTERGAPLGIIHNAGITRDALHIHQAEQDWYDVINTNLNSVFHWHSVLLNAMMMQGRGSIVMMSSVSAIKGNTGQVAYSATKAAMTGMARSLAREVARFGIRVNCILPGLIETEMMQKLSDAERKKLRALIPLRRIGSEDDVIQAAEYLMSDASSYMTGQSLVVDGGMTI